MERRDLKVWDEEEGWSSGRAKLLATVDMGVKEISQELGLDYTEDNSKFLTQWFLLVSFPNIGQVSFAAEDEVYVEKSGIYINSNIEATRAVSELKKYLALEDNLMVWDQAC